MENNIQIALFYEQNYYIDTVLMAGKLKEKINELGEGTVLPYSHEIKTPIIIFNNSNQIKLLVYTSHVLVTFPINQTTYLQDNLKKIFDLLKKEKINISRIGYIKTIVLGQQEAELYKNNAFDDNEILHADEYQLSYYKLVKIDKLNVNCWKKYFTDKEKFIISFDFNTLMEEAQKIDMQFVIKYMENCDQFIEKNQVANLF